MKIALLAAAALVFATPAFATDFRLAAGYQDSEAAVVTATVSQPLNPNLALDVTGAVEGGSDSFPDVRRLEAGATVSGGRFAVRGAVGQLWSDYGTEFGYYSVTPAVAFDVPLTDSFVVAGRYRNAFDRSGFETYGGGAQAGWNVGDFQLTAGAFMYTGDQEYNEYTVGISRKF